MQTPREKHRRRMAKKLSWRIKNREMVLDGRLNEDAPEVRIFERYGST